jgi:hypothetical protein
MDCVLNDVGLIGVAIVGGVVVYLLFECILNDVGIITGYECQ